MNKSNLKRISFLFVLFLVLALCSNLVSLIRNNVIWGHDFKFHFNRLLGLENVFYSPVSFNSFSHSGTYVNMLYPWLTMFPLRILYKLTHNYLITFNIFHVFLGFLTLSISYYVMHKMTKDTKVSLCFSIIYSFSLYRIMNINLRSALGETIAMTFLPLLLLGIYYVFFDDEKKWYVLSLSLASMAYTHILSLILSVGGTLLIGVVSFYWWDKKSDRLISSIKAGVFFVLLSLGALVPVVYASVMNKVYVPPHSSHLFGKSALSLSDIFHNALNNPNTANSFGLLVLIVFVGFFYIRSKYADKKSKEYPLAMFFISVSIALIILSSSIIPWYTIANLPVIGLIRIIQFLWRLNAYSTLLICAAFALILKSTDNRFKINSTIFLSLVGICLSWFAIMNIQDREMLNEDRILNIKDTRVYTYRVDDYAPMKTDEFLKKNSNGDNPDFSLLEKINVDGKESNEVASILDKGTIYHVDINGLKKGETIDVPVYWFNTVHVKVDEKEVVSSMSKRGTVQFEIPQDGDASIDIYHTYPKIIYISWFISLLSLIVMSVREYTKIRKVGNIQ